jgi:hypothetical protein
MMGKRLFAMTITLLVAAAGQAQWSQFGANPRHTGNSAVAAQPLLRTLADVVHDPFVPQEIAPNGALYIHYAVPLLDGDDVFMSFKGVFAPGPSPSIITWGVKRLHWENGQLVEKWVAGSDWGPVPSVAWEPPMQPVLANGFVYLPAAGATLFQIDRNTGQRVTRINPFATLDYATFMSGPPTADASGNIIYGAFRVQSDNPWGSDVTGAWLVRATPDGTATAVPFSPLVSNAPAANAQCTSRFASGTKLPPSPTAVAPTITCGSQRPGLNVAPAIAADGTIYIVSRTHFNERWGYLVAVNPDLTPKWNVSLRNRFQDGCDVLLVSGTCTAGTTAGVDPTDNLPGSGAVSDFSTASPVVLPDGTILYGAFTGYNDSNGHLTHFKADSTYIGAYPFGWDTTPAVWQHNGTFSIVTKHNFYFRALRPDPGEFIVQLDPNLTKEWEYRNPSTLVCHDGDCEEEPFGFEWCVNAPAIDANGTVYANAEDGILYAIGQGGIRFDHFTLAGPLGAAYTPLAIDAQGRVYAQTGGHLFAVGGSPARKRAVR